MIGPDQLATTVPHMPRLFAEKWTHYVEFSTQAKAYFDYNRAFSFDRGDNRSFVVKNTRDTVDHFDQNSIYISDYQGLIKSNGRWDKRSTARSLVFFDLVIELGWEDRDAATPFYVYEKEWIKDRSQQWQNVDLSCRIRYMIESMKYNSIISPVNIWL